MTFEVHVTGLKEIAEDFQKIPSTLGEATIKSAITKATQPMLQEIIRRSPYLDAGRNGPSLEQLKAAFKDKGFRKAWPGQLQASIKRQWIKGYLFRDLQAGCYIGPTVFYANFIEFGTARQPARPFVGPAFDATIEATIDATKEEMGKAIDKVLHKYGWR